MSSARWAGPEPRAVGDPTRRPGVGSGSLAEARRALAGVILPALRREGASPVAQEVDRLVASGELGELALMPERSRRAVLAALEREISRRPGALPPRTVVAVTTLVSGTPAPSARCRRAGAAPAR